MRTSLVWAVTLGICLAALIAAMNSPLLAWRGPVYIGAGLCGVIALCLLLFQPLFATGHWLGLSRVAGRRIHLWVGRIMLLLVGLHIAGLWITSPPDMLDALLLRSPTPFSNWGVIALWAIISAALLVQFRNHMAPRNWRLAHIIAATITVVGTIAHTLQIEGTMGTISKWILCLIIAFALLKTLSELRIWTLLKRPR